MDQVRGSSFSNMKSKLLKAGLFVACSECTRDKCIYTPSKKEKTKGCFCGILNSKVILKCKCNKGRFLLFETPNLPCPECGGQLPVANGDPVEVIKSEMKQRGLKQKDLIKCMGGKNRVSEVLSYKIPLNLRMIKNLHKLLNIPYDLLIEN